MKEATKVRSVRAPVTVWDTIESIAGPRGVNAWVLEAISAKLRPNGGMDEKVRQELVAKLVGGSVGRSGTGAVPPSDGDTQAPVAGEVASPPAPLRTLPPSTTVQPSKPLSDGRRPRGDEATKIAVKAAKDVGAGESRAMKAAGASVPAPLKIPDLCATPAHYRAKLYGSRCEDCGGKP